MLKFKLIRAGEKGIINGSLEIKNLNGRIIANGEYSVECDEVEQSKSLFNMFARKINYEIKKTSDDSSV